ncbi:Chemotaxis protein CheC -- inhibitor of MCP methylation [Candidatus Syntrophocurvum alkaliphilum]|uniref:Chemotaxis protein CheC--inhibitor of MCP methylation n=1 Tax=Candidatus Syntrophocurvum alkaliphilum TaxID=2293317 RepID=A0A6I6DDR1_9FIRM|nr:chemotaxis protein CheC [Candidatus Syntrophocurvum alkaliphilum]QGT99190.1 Chemotaxis protein CheC -- inhibitor of MCP methylation [Candidatus Syntrophocurvum alkaliphilum]
MTRDYNELSGLEIDALKEIGNIGAGNAATALGQMVNDKIDMSVPNVNILPFQSVPDLIGGADSHVVGVFFNVSGSAPTNIIFVLPIEKASLLIDMLMGRPVGQTLKEQLDDMEISAMMELGNIIAATYLNALGMFTQLDFSPSVPAIGIDMAGAIVDAVLAQFGEVADHVLVLETNFKKDEKDVVGHFFLLPEPGSLDTILSALGVSLNE